MTDRFHILIAEDALRYMRSPEGVRDADKAIEVARRVAAETPNHNPRTMMVQDYLLFVHVVPARRLVTIVNTCLGINEAKLHKLLETAVPLPVDLLLLNTPLLLT